MSSLNNLHKFWKLFIKLLTGSSWLSLVLNILLAFIFIKFIFYPLLSLGLQTQMPVVAVISNSMEHDSSLDNWWQVQYKFYGQMHITLKDFKYFPFSNGFNKGDMMIIKGVKISNLKVGDVIVFKTKKPYPIIHRVVALHNSSGYLYVETKGDHNIAQIKNSLVDESFITKEQLIGKAVFRIPKFGWIKIIFSRVS